MERAQLAAARYQKGWSQEQAAERVGVTRRTLSQWERGMADPHPFHIYRLCEVYGKSVVELGLERSSKKKTRRGTNVPERRIIETVDQSKGISPLPGMHEDEEHPIPFQAISQGDPEISGIEPIQHLEKVRKEFLETSSNVSLVLPHVDMLMISRRQILHDMLNAACAALTLSPSALLPQSSRERLEMIIARPSHIDEEALGDLAVITQKYWGLSKNASIDLLSGISGHFTVIAQLLKESHPTPIYEKLCMLVSENALLLGKTFHDIREYHLAWDYYKFSLKIAQDTHNRDLWANGVGRIALLLIYWGQPQQALPLLREAQRNDIHNQRLKPWLSAIEAEIHAMMGDVDGCLRSLEQSRNVTLPTSFTDDIYATGFNPSRAAGYEGACFVRLRQPERALPALQEALMLCDPTSLRRRSTLFADIGTVHAQLGDVKTACELILHSLDMTAQTKSLVVLQRIYKGRRALDPWKNSATVKNLDERVDETLTELIKLKEQV